MSRPVDEVLAILEAMRNEDGALDVRLAGLDDETLQDLVYRAGCAAYSAGALVANAMNELESRGIITVRHRLAGN